MSEILVGKLVADRYRVVRRLGAGGMGTVYVAVQEPLGREIALKVVRRDLSHDERAMERFRREAQTLSQAHHPHIVTVLDFGELASGELYLAMELVPGENLRQRLARTGPLPVKKTLTLIRDTAAALASAHRLGIVHRDLKPENILLMEAAGSPDFVKVVDFGVAKLTSEKDLKEQEQLTQRGSVVGTPGYIAPEIALRGVTSDARSDLYALGVVWFECLSGRAPFQAPTATALLMAHALDPIPALPAQIPLPIAGLVQRLLAKSPEDRPSSAEELSALIDTLPPFESGTAVPRPNVVAVPVEANAATIDDSSRHSPRPGAGPPPHAVEPAKVFNTEMALPTEISAPVAGPLAPPAPPSTAPATAGVLSVPTSTSGGGLGADRRSLLLAAALIGGAIVVAAVVVATMLRQPPVENPTTPEHPVHSDAGPAAAAAVDAGSQPVLVPAHGPKDAGTLAHDAGMRPAKPDAGVKKKPVRPATPTGEHPPDIYSD